MGFLPNFLSKVSNALFSSENTEENGAVPYADLKSYMQDSHGRIGDALDSLRETSPQWPITKENIQDNEDLAYAIRDTGRAIVEYVNRAIQGTAKLDNDGSAYIKKDQALEVVKFLSQCREDFEEIRSPLKDIDSSYQTNDGIDAIAKFDANEPYTLVFVASNIGYGEKEAFKLGFMQMDSPYWNDFFKKDILENNDKRLLEHPAQIERDNLHQVVNPFKMNADIFNYANSLKGRNEEIISLPKCQNLTSRMIKEMRHVRTSMRTMDYHLDARNAEFIADYYASCHVKVGEIKEQITQHVEDVLLTEEKKAMHADQLPNSESAGYSKDGAATESLKVRPEAARVLDNLSGATKKTNAVTQNPDACSKAKKISKEIEAAANKIFTNYRSEAREAIADLVCRIEPLDLDEFSEKIHSKAWNDERAGFKNKLLEVLNQHQKSIALKSSKSPGNALDSPEPDQ